MIVYYKCDKRNLGIGIRTFVINTHLKKGGQDMEIINVMQRIEMKYILSKEQLEYLKDALKEHMVVDKYGKTSISSLYFDTPNNLLIRTSIDKPAYKEKVRLRSYDFASEKVFLEIKRKAEGIVYKRRISLSEEEAKEFFNHNYDISSDNQISKEISYFRNYYKDLEPSILVIYDRTAYEEINGGLRLTIDENPRYRLDHLDLHTSLNGIPLLEDGSAILEIKVQEVIPLWLVSILSQGKIYQSSFSKVGEAYKKAVLSNAERKEESWVRYSSYCPVLTKSLSH